MSAPRTVDIIGAAWGLGGADPSCADAPALLAPLLAERLRQCDCACVAGPLLRARPGERRKDYAVSQLCGLLASAVADALRHGRLPCVLGGDHSCAGGTWSGVARALSQGAARLGLVWIDAHMDSHTPETSHTGRLHGMPLAWLLGEHDDPLYGLASGVVQPGNVSVVGVRSFEPEEEQRLRRLGVRVFMMEEVRQRGVAAVLGEALAIATTNGARFGVSIDLDAVTPEEAPGVGTPVAGGIGSEELRLALQVLHRRDDLLALELVEYSPRADQQGRSAQVAVDLLQAALCGRVDRPGQQPQILANPLHRGQA